MVTQFTSQTISALGPRTKYCQPAMYIGGLAAFELLKKDLRAEIRAEKKCQEIVSSNIEDVAEEVCIYRIADVLCLCTVTVSIDNFAVLTYEKNLESKCLVANIYRKHH